MAQTESILRSWHNPGQNRVFSSPSNRVVSSSRCRIGICYSIILLCGTATCIAGGSGPGLGIKVGAQTIESPFDFEKTTRARFELEIASQRFGDEHLDLAFTFGGSSLGSSSDEYTGFDNGVLIGQSFTDRLSLLDLRLAARLYPFGESARLQPYVGAGIGYFWSLDSWEDQYSETVEDPYFPGVFYTFTDVEEGRDTIAHGFFPFVSAGLTVPVRSNFDLLFEFQYHFDKQDSGFDFSGPVYMFGCCFRF